MTYKEEHKQTNIYRQNVKMHTLITKTVNFNLATN